METLDRILASLVAKDGEQAGRDKLLGAAFVVVNKDGIVYQGAAGRVHSDTDANAAAAAFAPDSCTWIASMTKLVTAVAVAQMVESGLVGFDDDVRPLVPQLARAQILRGFVGNDIPYLVENTSPITLRQLLTHTAGFVYAAADPDLIRWAKHIGRDEERLQGDVELWNTPLKFAPGRGWYYGTGCDWAGQVLEKLTRQPLGAFMHAHVFRPLRMTDTAFRPAALPHLAPRLVPPAHRDPATGALATSAGAAPPPAERRGGGGGAAAFVHSGGAGLHTTAADFARLLQALLAAGAGDGDSGRGGAAAAPRLLRQTSAAELFRPQLTAVQRRELNFLAGLFHDGMAPEFEPGMPLDHGLGGAINLEDAPGKRRKGSMMWGGMTNGHWFIDRTAGVGATLITNVLPHPDTVAARAWDELERAVYSDLIKQPAR